MKVKVGPPGPAQRWHRGLAEENLCHNKFNLYEAEDEFERGESECHVLPGRLFACAPARQSGQPHRPANLAPAAAATASPISAQTIGNPVRAAQAAATPVFSSQVDVLLLPDGSEMRLGDFQPVKQQTVLVERPATKPNHVTSADALFDNYLKEIETSVMKEFSTKYQDRSHRTPNPNFASNLYSQTPVLPQTRPGDTETPKSSFLGLMGLDDPGGGGGGRQSRRPGLPPGIPQGAGGGGSGGGGGDRGGIDPGHGGTPLAGPWTNIEISLDPRIFGDSAKPYTKESVARPFLVRLKALFKKISARSVDNFTWTPVDSEEATENGIFLAMVLLRFVVNVGPLSLQKFGLVDVFQYPYIAPPAPPANPGDAPEAQRVADQKVQGVKLDFSTKYVLSGVSKEDPKQFFTVVDVPCDGGNLAADDPEEIFLRPAISLAWRMLSDLRSKKIKPTIISGFPSPYNLSINGNLVINELMPMLGKVTDILHCVFEVQMAADDLADALELINPDNIDEVEKEIEELVVGSEAAPSPLLCDKVLKLSEGARLVNRLYNKYEMIARGVDQDGVGEEAARRTFANPALLIKFLHNSSEPACPWIREPSKWSTANSYLTNVSSSGHHTLDGGRLKVMQSPSRFLIERHYTHVDKTIDRISAIKRQVFARMESNQISTSPQARQHFGGQKSNQFETPLRPPLHHWETERKNDGENGTFGAQIGAPSTPASIYPNVLMQAAENLSRVLLDPDGPQRGTPAYILTGYIDQVTELIREVRKVEWSGHVVLKPDHQKVRDDLTRIKTVLQGFLADHNRDQKSKESQEREVARSLSFAKGPILKEDGENIDQFLEYHEAFKASNPLARTLKIRNDLPSRLQARVENISDPEEIVQLLKDTFLQSDILIPQALKLVTDCKINPKVNSKEEQSSYCAISSLIKRLEKQDLLGRLDFTMISACIARLSPQRIDDFELSWLKKKMATTGLSTSEEEQLKRNEFIAFVQLHEVLLQKRTVQNNLLKKEDKEPKRERAFQTGIPRETKLDRKKRIKDAEKNGGTSTGDPKHNNDQYVCPLCNTPGGHPKKFGARAGQSPKTLARCEVFKNTPPNKRMALVLELKSCALCLQTNHQLNSCKLDKNATWLTHEGCTDRHNPLVCPSQKVERSCVTNTTGSPAETTSSLHDDIVVILAEQVEVRDQAGRAHSCIAVHDTLSDSSWVSSELAKTFPQKKRKKVTIPLQTVRGTSSFQTWEYQIGVRNEATNTLKMIRVFESPSVGSLHYNGKVHKLLQESFGTNVHFPRGDVQLLIGVRDHTFSPDSIRSHESLNLKLYKSALNPSRHLVCGSLPSAFIEGLESGERSMFTQSELTKILLQDKGIDMVPQLCDFCKNKSLDCSECKLLNRPTSLRELTENELIKANLFFDKDKKIVCCKYVPSFSTWAEIFPPHLKNDAQARKVSRGLLKSLNKNNMLEQFQGVFQNFVNEGIFQELTKEDMKKWEDEKRGVNYINFHHVLKNHSQEERQKLRIVTNSSANRTGVVDGKLTECSLNACLPQGFAAFNQLEEVAISWMSAPTSLLLDVRKAYSNIRDCQGDDQNKHLRRMIWYRDPVPGKDHDEMEEVTYGIGPCHYGDRNAACLLANTMLKVAEDMSNDLGSIPSNDPGSNPSSDPGSNLNSDPSIDTFGAQTTLPPANSQTVAGDAVTKFLKSMFVDDFIVNCEHPEEAFKLYEIYKRYLGNYSMMLHEPVISSAEGRHMTQEGVPLKEPPPDEPKSMMTIGFDFCPYTDSYKVPIQKRLKPSKKGKFKMKIGTDLTKESILAMERVSLRQIASFNASIFDLCGHLAPVKIFGKRLLARIVEANPPTTKEAWDKDLPPDLLEEARQYLLLMTTLTEPEFQRGPPLPGAELTDLASFHDGSSCAYGTGIWGIWTRGEERRAKLLYAKARTAKRTIVDQELSSLHQSVQISRVFLRIFPQLKRVFHLGDSEVSHKQICTINCPKDTWTLNRVRDIVTATKELTSQGVEVKFFHIKSEHNLSDKISKPVDDAQNFVHSSTWKFGFEWLKTRPEDWPVDKVMHLNTSSGLIEVSPGPASLGPVPHSALRGSQLEPVQEKERAMLNKESNSDEEEVVVSRQNQEGEMDRSTIGCSENPDIGGKSGDDVNELNSIFSDLLHRVSKIRVATRAIARIKNMAKQKSFLGLKKTPSEEEESSGWFLLVKDQQPLMDEKKITEEKYMVFNEGGIVFSRQRWDISTHLDIFQVDKLPLLEVDSRLGQLLLANAHRPAAGPCRTRSHVKYHLRSCRVAALLTGPVEKMLTQLMAKCIPCRKRKIALKDGELTAYSPRMKADRFKTSHPKPFSKISCDTLGPIRVSLDTAGVGTRRVARYAEHHVLVIACIAGSGACKYIQIPSTSSDGFAIGLHRLVASTGYPPSVVFTDFGSGLVSAGKKEQTRVANAAKMAEENDETVIPKILTDRYPSILFECAKSSEQVKNGKAESLCKAFKLYIKDVLHLKPNASIPEFTVLGLDLLCEEATKMVCSRPTAYLGSQNEVITPNHFLLAGFSDRVWGTEGELPTKYLQLQQYRERMYQVLERMMINADFTPKKWTQNERMPQIGDICLVTRQKGKISHILEYGQVLGIEDNGRTLKMKVCRQGTNNVKEISVSSRLANLLFRP